MAQPTIRELTETSRVIRREIQTISDAIRARTPWMKHQNAIGATVFLVSAAAIVANAVLYRNGVAPAWFVIPLSAFFMSLLHELEHDLIHRCYFPRNRFVFNAMMLGVWLFRPSTVSPWHRRDLHLHHHKVSGTESDLEERGITNGERWGLRRLLMTADGMLSVYLRPFETREMIRAYIDAKNPATHAERKKMAMEARLSYFPLGVFHFTAWHFFVIYHVAAFVAELAGSPIQPTGAMATFVDVWTFIVVVWLAPNVLRSFCLFFISSNMHYYGDVEPGNVLKQTQVWNAWWLFPLQLFCFNFGSTHGIHHFYVRDPFYIRQMTARRAHAVMREHGVRFNDFDSLRRANRWERVEAASPELASAAI